jgi:hypothetical protein
MSPVCSIGIDSFFSVENFLLMVFSLKILDVGERSLGREEEDDMPRLT